MLVRVCKVFSLIYNVHITIFWVRLKALHYWQERIEHADTQLEQGGSGGLIERVVISDTEERIK